MTAPWTIRRFGPRLWSVLHPPRYAYLGVPRRITHFPTHAEALAFVLAQPEVRRRTSNAARAVQGVAAAFDPYSRSADA